MWWSDYLHPIAEECGDDTPMTHEQAHTTGDIGVITLEDTGKSLFMDELGNVV